MDQYFNQMEKIVKERKTSSRIRFMLQDVIDLRLVSAAGISIGFRLRALRKSADNHRQKFSNAWFQYKEKKASKPSACWLCFCNTFDTTVEKYK